MSRAAEPHFQRWGWGTSVFLHASILLLGSWFIIRPPQFGIAVAPTSSEVELVEAAPPVPPKIVPPPPEVTPPPKPDDVLVRKDDARPVPQPVTPIQKKTPASTHDQHVKSAAARESESAAPDYLHNPPPVYPKDSQQAHEQGTVMVWAEVSADGDVESVTLRQSSGYLRLDHAALEAVRHWKFHPASVGGLPIEAEVAVPVRFLLQ